MIVRVKEVFRKTAVGDRVFNYLSGSHLQSQVKSRPQMMVFMSLVAVLIGQFDREMIGRDELKVAVIGWIYYTPCYWLCGHEHMAN